MKLLYHEAKLASLSYILVLIYIYATLQPTRLLTCLLKKLHFHFLRSMHSQDVTRLIRLVTSRNNRSCFRLPVLLYDRKSSSLPSTDEAKSSFFDPACIDLNISRARRTMLATYGVSRHYQASRFQVCKIGAGYL